MAKLIKTSVVLLTTLLLVGTSLGIWALLWKNDKQNDSDLTEITAVTENTESTVFGRGFQTGQRSTIEGEKANPEYRIRFPVDYRAHDNFDIEWWYLTANLQDEDSNHYGLQWTLFRFKSPSVSNGNTFEKTSKNNWQSDQIYMAHASIHSMQSHWFDEKLARGGVGNAGQTDNPFSLFIDDWLWQNSASFDAAPTGLLPAKLQFSLPQISESSEGDTVDVELKLNQTGPYVFHGENGYSIKSGNARHASHYYSAPFIDISGQFLFHTDSNNEKSSLRKTLTGSAWYDQEWTSQLLDTSTLGWDWLSLHLDDGSKIMAFRMRLKNQQDYITGSFIQPDGQLTTLAPSDLSLIPEDHSMVRVAEKQVSMPLGWKLEIPSKGISISINTEKKDQWNPAIIPYYEGMVSVSGTHSGRGFLELTGYESNSE